MSPDRRSEIRRIADEARELPPDEVPSFLDQRCPSDEHLRREVEELLAMSRDLDAIDSIFEDEGHEFLIRDTQLLSVPPSAMPAKIGPYKILDVLGEGGMGIVYLAQQYAPVRRRVALKIIKLGMNTREVIARFEAERQALALMDHPNISHVYDAGSTEDGRPYFVMEQVHGLPITEFSDRHRLSVRDRLRLFAQVCRAVQHAHHHGIIHRDLKPSNILVSQPEDEPVAKIIDFGVAKATNHRLTRKTIYTEIGRVVGTPAYMSPEQAELTSDAIDHRTDVYSLGIILYELLVGELPLDEEFFEKAAFDEVLRHIREEDPPTPSTRWTRLNVNRTARLAAVRQSSPTAISRELKHDLDWVVMRAIAKEPGRRYSTASEFAADVERYLSQQAVIARPPGALYRIEKFVRKNRIPVLAATSVILALLVGLVTSLVLYGKASDNYRLAEDHRKETEAARIEEMRSRLAVEAQKRRAEAMLSRSQLERATELLESGNSFGLLGLLEARESAANSPRLRRAVGWLWAAWHQIYRRQLAHVYGPLFDQYYGRMAISADRRWVATAAQRRVQIWDVADGLPVGQPLYHSAVMSRITFGGADGRLLAAATKDGTIKVWHTTTGKWTGLEFQHGAGEILRMEFSPDAALLASASEAEGTVRLWSLETGRPQGAPMPHEGVSLLEFGRSDGGLLLTRSPDGRTRLWLAATGKPLRPNAAVELDSSPTEYATFSEDGTLLALARQGTVSLWQTDTWKESGQGFIYGGRCSHLAFRADGTLLAGGFSDGAVRLWNMASGQAVGTQLQHGSATARIAFGEGDTLVATAGMEGRIKLWEIASARLLAGPFSELGRVHRLALGAGDSLLVVGTNRGIGHAYSTHRDPIGIPRQVAGKVLALAFSPDARWLAIGTSEGRALLHETGSAGPPRELTKQVAAVTSLTFRPDGQILFVGGADGIVRSWRWSADEAPSARASFDHGQSVASIRVTPDGLSLVTASTDGSVKLWDLRTHRLREEQRSALFIGPDELLGVGEKRLLKNTRDFEIAPSQFGASCNADGTLIARGSESGLTRLWHRQLGLRVGEPLFQEGRIRAVAFSPRGDLLATASDDHTVRLWFVGMDPPHYGVPLRHEGPCLSLAYSPDGKMLATGTASGSFWLWTLPRVVDARTMRLRTQVALGARPDRGGNPAPIQWYEWMLLREELETSLEEAASAGLALAKTQDANDRRRGFSEYLRSLNAARSRIRSGDVRRVDADYDRTLSALRRSMESSSIGSAYYAQVAVGHGLLVLRESGSIEQAEEGVDQVIALLEDTALDSSYSSIGLYCNNRAWWIVKHTRPAPDLIQPAVFLARCAVRISPDVGNFWNTLGVACYRAGQWQDAVDALEKSTLLKAAGGDAEDWFVLAMSHWNLGDKTKASSCYQAGMKWLRENEARFLDSAYIRFREEAQGLLGVD